MPVCPVDCFFERPGEARVYIKGTECIDCLCCYLVCPEEAIQPDTALAGDDTRWIDINRQVSAAPEARRVKGQMTDGHTPVSVQGRSAATAHRGERPKVAPPAWWSQPPKKPRVG